MQMTQFLSSLDELLDQEPGTLTADSRLDDFGWSSLAVVGFIAFVDEQFEATVSPRILAGCETASDLAALLGGKVTTSPVTV